MAPLDDWRAYVEKPDRFDGHRFEALMLALDSADSLHEAKVSCRCRPNGSRSAWAMLD